MTHDASKPDHWPAADTTVAASVVAERPFRALPGHALPQKLGAAVEAAFHMASEAVFFLTTDLRIVTANRSAVGGSGYRLDELQGLRIDDVFHGGDVDRAIQVGLEQLLRHGNDDDTVLATHRDKDGALRRARIKLRLVRDEETPLLVAVVSDFDNRRRPKFGAAREAHRDHLTGLSNRAALDRRLRRAERLARRHGSRFALLFVDVDGFKSVNDIHGHRAGDRVLRSIARQLRAGVRPGDFAARYGGDEFVVLIERLVDDAEVERIRARLCTELSVSATHSGERLTVTVSVGAAVSQGATSAMDLLDAADQAMYRAKFERFASVPDQLRRA